jgi:hemerythrin-like domain-containing protein
MKREPALVPLSREHHTALLLALRIERELPGGAASAVEAVYSDLIAFWARGLLPHFRAEGECLLARLVRHVPLEHESVLRLNRDHLAIVALVARMRDTSDVDDRRAALVEFAAELRSHIRWEEDELFQATQDLLTPEEMAALGEEIKDRVGDGVTGAEDVWPDMMKRGKS